MRTSLRLLNLLIFVLAPMLSAQSVIAPHLTRLEGEFRTAVTVLNTATEARTATLNGVAADGSAQEQYEVTLEAGQSQTMVHDGSLFGNDAAWLNITHDKGVRVSLAYQALADDAAWADVPLTTATATDWRLALGNPAQGWDGIALVNTGYRSGEVRITLHQAGSDTSQEHRLTLEAGTKTRLVLNEVLDLAGTGQLASPAHVEIHADEPLAVTALRGDHTSTVLWTNQPIALSSTAPIRQIPLPGDDLFPEGVAIHQQTGEIFVSSIGGQGIYKVVNGVATSFVTPEQVPMYGTVGMTVDEERNRLWVVSSAFINPNTGAAPNTDPNFNTSIIVLDTRSGELLYRYDLSDETQQHFFNDIDLDQQGNAYFTNTLYPSVYRIPADLSEATVLADNDRFFSPIGTFGGLNGIAVTEDQQYAITTTIFAGEEKLYRIDLETGETLEINLGGTVYTGGDGLLFADSHTMLVIAQMNTIVQFSDDYAVATIRPFPEFEGFHFPTTAKIYKNHLYVVNAQFDRLGGQPDPFTMTVVPLERLFAR